MVSDFTARVLRHSSEMAPNHPWLRTDPKPSMAQRWPQTSLGSELTLVMAQRWPLCVTGQCHLCVCDRSVPPMPCV